MTRWIVLGIAVVAVAALAWRFWPRESAEAEEGAAPPSVTADIFVARTVGVPEETTVTGTVRPKMEATLSSKLLARIESVGAWEGDRVRRGAALIVLDARDLNASVRQAEAAIAASSGNVDAANAAVELERRQAEARIRMAEANLEAVRARLDEAEAGPREQERRQAALAVREAEAALRLAEADYARYRQLYEQDAVSKRALDQAQTQLDVARARVNSAREAESLAREGTREETIRSAREAVRAAEAEVEAAKSAKIAVEMRRKEAGVTAASLDSSVAALRSAQALQSYHRILAPFDGVVTKRLVDPGSTAAPGAPLLTIESAGPKRLEAEAPERALASVKVGDRLPVTLDALPGREVTGTVVEIVPNVNPGTHTATVKIELPADAAIMSGMYGRARIETGRAEAVVVPPEALVRRDGLEYVWTVDGGGRARLRLVTTGRPTTRGIPILTGLADGDRVILGGKPTEGAPVRER